MYSILVLHVPHASAFTVFVSSAESRWDFSEPRYLSPPPHLRPWLFWPSHAICGHGNGARLIHDLISPARLSVVAVPCVGRTCPSFLD